MNGKIVSLLVSLTVIVGSVLTVKGYEMYMFEYSIDGDVLNVTKFLKKRLHTKVMNMCLLKIA